MVLLARIELASPTWQAGIVAVGPQQYDGEVRFRPREVCARPRSLDILSGKYAYPGPMEPL